MKIPACRGWLELSQLLRMVLQIALKRPLHNAGFRTIAMGEVG
jgi:hypothetical protein